MKIDANSSGLESMYNDLGTFKARATEEIKRAKRYPTFISLVLMDVSHINSSTELENFSDLDQFHFGLGDLVRKSVRETDLISNNGSGKIAILLIETPKEGASAFAERLKKTVKYFLCNNTKSPVNWRVPTRESYFPGSTREDNSILGVLESIGN
jgi:GGDEF domain-containing protein